jgi:hypothetical protein
VHIFFDVDLTIISEDGSLRPLVPEVFQRLAGDGHRLYLWSGNGIRWSVAERFGLREWLSGCFYKPLYDFRRAVARQGLPVLPDFCVDDYPEVVVEFGGLQVAPYGEPNPEDREMLRVYESVRGWRG